MGNLYTGAIISDTPVEDGSVTEGDVEEATRVYPRVPRERNTP